MNKKGKNLYLIKTITPALIALAIVTTIGSKIVLNSYLDIVEEEALDKDLKDKVVSVIDEDDIDISPSSIEVVDIDSTTKQEDNVKKEKNTKKKNKKNNNNEEQKEVEIHRDLLDNGYKFQEIDFDTLKSINSDVCGWIKLDGTVIDYPILKANQQKPNYYLEHDINGNDSINGEIFVDSYNNSLESDYYDLSDITAIHGHHMASGQMFDAIANFDNQSFYDDHKYAVIYTPDGYAYKATFIAGVVCEVSDVDLVYREFKNENQFDKFIDKIKEKSRFTTKQSANYGDKLVILNTCYYEYQNDNIHRFLLYARLDKELIYEKKDNKKLSKKR